MNPLTELAVVVHKQMLPPRFSVGHEVAAYWWFSSHLLFPSRCASQQLLGDDVVSGDLSIPWQLPIIYTTGHWEPAMSLWRHIHTMTASYSLHDRSLRACHVSLETRTYHDSFLFFTRQVIESLPCLSGDTSIPWQLPILYTTGHWGPAMSLWRHVHTMTASYSFHDRSLRACHVSLETRPCHDSFLLFTRQVIESLPCLFGDTSIPWQLPILYMTGHWEPAMSLWRHVHTMTASYPLHDRSLRACHVSLETRPYHDSFLLFTRQVIESLPCLSGDTSIPWQLPIIYTTGHWEPAMSLWRHVHAMTASYYLHDRSLRACHVSLETHPCHDSFLLFTRQVIESLPCLSGDTSMPWQLPIIYTTGHWEPAMSLWRHVHAMTASYYLHDRSLRACHVSLETRPYHDSFLFFTRHFIESLPCLSGDTSIPWQLSILYTTGHWEPAMSLWRHVHTMTASYSLHDRSLRACHVSLETRPCHDSFLFFTRQVIESLPCLSGDTSMPWQLPIVYMTGHWEPAMSLWRHVHTMTASYSLHDRSLRACHVSLETRPYHDSFLFFTRQVIESLPCLSGDLSIPWQLPIVYTTGHWEPAMSLWRHVHAMTASYSLHDRSLRACHVSLETRPCHDSFLFFTRQVIESLPCLWWSATLIHLSTWDLQDSP